MSKIKIVFLDIDGVLNTEHGLKTISNNWTEFSKIEDNPFCPEACSVLNKIISQTGAKIVISSTWRHSGIEYLRSLWKERDLPGEIIGITPDSSHGIRGREVDEYLKSNGFYYPISYWNAPAWEESRSKCQIESYCIIDDDTDFFIDQINHFVKVDPYYGLAQEGKFEEIIKCLNIKY